jgi:hypothetical protein
MFGISFGGMIAKLAGNAILGRVGTNAKADIGALFKWIGRRTPLELIGFVFAALFVIQHFHLVHTRHDLASCTAARADDAKALKASHANEKLLRGQLDDQNRLVTALSVKSAAGQKQAAQALQKAAPRALDAKEIAAALLAASQRKPAPTAPGKPPAVDCEPSDLVKEQWK